MVPVAGRQKGGGRPGLARRVRARRDVLTLVLAITILCGLSYSFPSKGERAMRASWENLREMAFILPAVLVIMGLFMVWVDRAVVVRFLGRGSGLRGMLTCIALGTLPTGPLYVGFPLAAALLKKGARPANVLAFLCSWAALSIPAELMELRFLGWRFMLARLGFTVLCLIPLALGGERLLAAGGRQRVKESGGGLSGVAAPSPVAPPDPSQSEGTDTSDAAWDQGPAGAGGNAEG